MVVHSFVSDCKETEEYVEGEKLLSERCSGKRLEKTV
jgi:hypothetical protein